MPPARETRATMRPTSPPYLPPVHRIGLLQPLLARRALADASGLPARDGTDGPAP